MTIKEGDMKKNEFTEFLARSPISHVKEGDQLYTVAYGFFLGGLIEGLKDMKIAMESLNADLKKIVGKDD